MSEFMEVCLCTASPNTPQNIVLIQMQFPPGGKKENKQTNKCHKEKTKAHKTHTHTHKPSKHPIPINEITNQTKLNKKKPPNKRHNKTPTNQKNTHTNHKPVLARTAFIHQSKSSVFYSCLLQNSVQFLLLLEAMLGKRDYYVLSVTGKISSSYKQCCHYLFK